MSEISPRQSSALARDIYLLVKTASLTEALDQLKSRYGNSLDLDVNESLVKGKSGGPLLLKSRTAFGLCVLGKGIHKGNAFIILRGTKFLGDWLTNLNVGVSRSVSGFSIHDGFHQAFLSMESTIRNFLAKLAENNVHSIHCIGHSLGGALATVCAEYVKANTTLSPYLYTFGAPRVGLKPFADNISRELQPGNMFRVYHRTDIVPCIPFWPFIHAPTLMASTYDYFQPSGGQFPGAEWHDIGKYFDTVKDHGWPELRGKRDRHIEGPDIEGWLNDKSPVSFSVTSLEWLDRAINYVITRCLAILGGALNAGLTTGFTLMDWLAYVLKKGIDLSKDLSAMVIALVRKMMSFLGMRPVLDKADATYAFIRGIFERMSAKVNAYCRRVLDDVLVNGQAV